MDDALTMTEEKLAAIGTLFKYRDAKPEYQWESLEEQYLYLPNPRSFNDPFDSNIFMRYDLLSYEEKYQLSNSFVREGHSDVKGHLREALIKQVINTIDNPERHDGAMQQWVDRMVARMRVFCACPDRDNILLWSHYANNHTGFAIGFDTMQLHQLWKDSGGLLLGHALYREEYPTLLPPGDDRMRQEKTTAIVMNIKSDIWHYENEIRLTMWDAPEKVSFKPELINQIVLGCKMNTSSRRRMLDLVAKKYPHATVYQAKPRRYAFALDFDQLM
jgi:hypothetical protein